MTVFTSYRFLFLFVFGSVCLCLVQSMLDSCCSCLDHVVWLAVVSPFSVAAYREWWFCLHGCLGEGTNAQIYVRTNVLAQIAVVQGCCLCESRILLKVGTHICVTSNFLTLCDR